MFLEWVVGVLGPMLLLPQLRPEGQSPWCGWSERDVPVLCFVVCETGEKEKNEREELLTLCTCADT